MSTTPPGFSSCSVDRWDEVRPLERTPVITSWAARSRSDMAWRTRSTQLAGGFGDGVRVGLWVGLDGGVDVGLLGGCKGCEVVGRGGVALPVVDTGGLDPVEPQAVSRRAVAASATIFITAILSAGHPCLHRGGSSRVASAGQSVAQRALS
jgi:hypothetical protein